MSDELATLGIAVDSTPVDSAKRSLDDLTRAAEKTEAATTSLTKATADGGERQKEVVRAAKVLRIEQNKTGRVLEIALSGQLLDLVKTSIGDIPVLHRPIVHTREGEAYTYSGLDAMLRRAQTKARKTLPALEPFGFRALKGKGATDMWLAGEQIERIQMLCGHKDKATTEIYVKSRWRESVQPNSIKIGA